MRSKLSGRVIALVSAVSVLGSSYAGAVTIQPDESNSEDVFTYQFHGANFGVEPFADEANLDTDGLATAGLDTTVGSLLGTSRSATTDHVIDDNGIINGGNNPQTISTGHDGFSWLKFDLSSASGLKGKAVTATLNLYAFDITNITPAFENPSPGAPVETEVYAAGGAWTEDQLTWATQGTALPTGGPEDTVTQTSVNNWVSFDVSSLVSSWLNEQDDNNGFVLQQNAIVDALNPTGGQTGVVSSIYASSNAGAIDLGLGENQSQFRPFLEVNEVPEPASLTILAAGGLLLLRRRR